MKRAGEGDESGKRAAKRAARDAARAEALREEAGAAGHDSRGCSAGRLPL